MKKRLYKDAESTDLDKIVNNGPVKTKKLQNAKMVDARKMHLKKHLYKDATWQQKSNK